MTHKQTAIPSRTRSAECLECSRPFVPTRTWSRFCGASCRAEHWRRTREEKRPPGSSREHAAGEMVRQGQLSAANHTAIRFIRKDSKIAAVLAELARGARLTRFDAERVCHDHTLPSTVSEIQRCSIRVERETVTVPGHNGKPTRCAMYWLTNEEREKAAKLLELDSWHESRPGS
jgi:hypothetical protein